MKEQKQQLYRGEIDPGKPCDWGRSGVSLEPDGRTICLILEGAYPYIAGGVSSWVQQLVTVLKDYRFKILTIMASRDQVKGLKYTFPPNVIEFRTVYLFDFLDLEQNKKARIRITDAEQEQLKKFLFFDGGVDWAAVTNLVCDPHRIGNTIDFLMSRTFFKHLSELYEERFTEEGFTIFFWTFRSMLATLLSVMQQELPEADVYHSISTGYAGLLGLIAKFRNGKPFLLTEHGIYAREREEEILKADWVQGIYKKLWIDYFYFLSQGAYDSCDLAIALYSHNSAIQQGLGVDKERAYVIPNGVNIEGFSQQKEPHEGFHIGAILRVVPIKDVKTLIKAFRHVHSIYDDTMLYIIGPDEEDEDYARECREMVKEMDLEQCCLFTGQVNIKEYMPIIDVIVLTSISEAQPLVILESYACATPVVASDVGSCRELVEGVGDGFGKGGIMTRPVSPRETADALIYLYEHPEERKQFGRNGMKRAEVIYSRSAVFEAYDEIYELALANASGEDEQLGLKVDRKGIPWQV